MKTRKYPGFHAGGSAPGSPGFANRRLFVMDDAAAGPLCADGHRERTRVQVGGPADISTTGL
ncbi:hypothetical protein, partial [Shinella sp. DD12]|uniref:hypothetical protein n=1 Tax=Shinella sp. DD12 TaxID=1410620 RepID=UPI001AEBAE53